MIAGNHEYRPRRAATLLLLCFLAMSLAGCGGRPTALLTPVQPTESATIVPVLAVTTRAPDTDPGVLFSGERSSEVSITAIDVSIPATGKSGQCNGREVRLLIRQESSLQLQRGSSIERAQ